MDFSGLIAYPVTPFTTAGAVDLPELARQVEVLVGSGVDSICVCLLYTSDAADE